MSCCRNWRGELKIVCHALVSYSLENSDRLLQYFQDTISECQVYVTGLVIKSKTNDGIRNVVLSELHVGKDEVAKK